MSRYPKTPAAKLEEFEILIRETNYSAAKCAELIGINGKTAAAQRIVKQYRRYFNRGRVGRWIDLRTDELRPAICDKHCAVEKTGLSAKTITRRISQGLIPQRRAVSHKQILVFLPSDIQRLKKIGRLKNQSNAILAPNDVRAIRQLAADGLTHNAIQDRYPEVTRRQISRIVSGQQRKEVK